MNSYTRGHSNRFVRKPINLPIYIPIRTVEGSSKQKLEKFFQDTLSPLYSWKLINSTEMLREYLISNQSAALIIHKTVSKEELNEINAIIKKSPNQPKLFLLADSSSSNMISYYLYHGISGSIEFPFSKKDLELLFQVHINNCIYEIN